MIPFFYFHEIWFVGDENNRNLNNLFQKLFCLPSKVTISTRVILRNSSKNSRMFYQLLFTQNVHISIIFLSVKSIAIRIKNWYHVSFRIESEEKYQFYKSYRSFFKNLLNLIICKFLIFGSSTFQAL